MDRLTHIDAQRTKIATLRISSGMRWAFDTPDGWNKNNADRLPPTPSDFAHAAARGVIADMRDRRGIKWQFDGLDEEIRIDIINAVADIIRVAYLQSNEPITDDTQPYGWHVQSASLDLMTRDFDFATALEALPINATVTPVYTR